MYPVVKRIAALLLAAALLSACGAGGQAPPSASAPSQAVPPEPPSQSAPPAPSAAPPSSSRSESAEEPSSPAEEPPPEILPEAPSTLPPNPTYEELKDIDLCRSALRTYLVETLTEEGYTGFYITEDQLGLGISAPDVEAVKEAVEAYDGPLVKLEYREVPNSRARLAAAKEAYERMEEGLAEHIVCNIAWSGVWDGLIHITIHQMHPALREFLDASEYADCFVVEITGAQEPIVNPDT